jgi:hypothetical protein
MMTTHRVFDVLRRSSAIAFSAAVIGMTFYAWYAQNDMSLWLGLWINAFCT